MFYNGYYTEKLSLRIVHVYVSVVVVQQSMSSTNQNVPNIFKSEELYYGRLKK